MRKKAQKKKVPLFTVKVYEVPGGTVCETMFRNDILDELPKILGMLLQPPNVVLRTGRYRATGNKKDMN
jgi:hypothetical protein